MFLNHIRVISEGSRDWRLE